MTEAQVDACSWSPYTGDSVQVAAKRRELAKKLKQGEVVFYRFNDVSGIFQFYAAQDNYNVQVDRCDDGVTGVGQNYIWDRYPGEVDPQVPAHTLSVGLSGHASAGLTGIHAPMKLPEPPVGLSGEPTGVGKQTGVGKCGTCGAIGVSGCCGQTQMEPTTQHHPQCEWEWGTCTCDQFAWDYSSAPDDPGCTYQEPNYGSDQIHLLKGVGPLGPANAADLRDTARAQAGVGQAPFPPAQTTNPDGTVTVGDITYTPPTSGPSTPGWTPPSTIMTPGTSAVSGTEIPLPYAEQTPPGSTAVTPGTPGTWASSPPPTAFVAPVAPSTNTGLLVAGLVAVGLGLGGIAYLAHARVAGS